MLLYNHHLLTYVDVLKSHTIIRICILNENDDRLTFEIVYYIVMLFQIFEKQEL